MALEVRKGAEKVIKIPLLENDMAVHVLQVCFQVD